MWTALVLTTVITASWVTVVIIITAAISPGVAWPPDYSHSQERGHCYCISFRYGQPPRYESLYLPISTAASTASVESWLHSRA
jgi:hypothetical protein